MSGSANTSGGPERVRRAGGCVMIPIAIAIAWAIATAVHAGTTWPHIPMDISANDPATRAAFDAVVQRHVVAHAIIGLAPLAAAIAFIILVCGKRR